MKKLILSILAITSLAVSFAQNDNMHKPASLGITFFANDFTTAAEIKKSGLGDAIRNHDLFRFNRLNFGVAANYLKGLSDHVDFTASLGGSFVQYPVPNQTISSGQNFLLEATAGLNVKLLSDKYWIVPFADFGVGVSKYLSGYGSFVPLGFGFQINLFDEAYIILNSQYRTPVSDNTASYLYHSLTIAAPLGGKKK